MRLRVLVVDNEDLVRQRLRRGLSRRGYDVGVAHDRHSALAAAQHSSPNWAIIDQRLTRSLIDRSGLDLADSLLAAHPQLRVLIRTAHPTIDAAFRAGRQARIVDYLMKPTTLDEICAKIEGRVIDGNPKPPKPASFEAVEHEHAIRVYADHDGNLTRAAKALGVSREALRRKLR